MIKVTPLESEELCVWFGVIGLQSGCSLKDVCAHAVCGSTCSQYTLPSVLWICLGMRQFCW